MGVDVNVGGGGVVDGVGVFGCDGGCERGVAKRARGGGRIRRDGGVGGVIVVSVEECEGEFEGGFCD